MSPWMLIVIIGLISIVTCAVLGWMLYAEKGILLGILCGPLGVMAAGFLRISTQPELSHEGQRRCPECAEWVLKEARKCRFCSSPLPTPQAKNTARAFR